MRVDEAKHAIDRIVRTILNPLGRPRRDVPRPYIEEEQGPTCHFARVVAGTFMRDAKAPTRELAIAKLLLSVESELTMRVAAGQERILEEEGLLAAARALLADHAAARKAVG